MCIVLILKWWADPSQYNALVMHLHKVQFVIWLMESVETVQENFQCWYGIALSSDKPIVISDLMFIKCNWKHFWLNNSWVGRQGPIPSSFYFVSNCFLIGTYEKYCLWIEKPRFFCFFNLTFFAKNHLFSDNHLARCSCQDVARSLLFWLVLCYKYSIFWILQNFL